MKKNIFIIITIICFIQQNSFAQDLPRVDSLLTILKTAPNDTNKVNLILSIGDEYETSQPLKAVDYYKQALAVAGQINNPLYKAICLEYLGVIYMQGLTKYDTAEIYYLECLKIRKEVLGEKHPEYATGLNNLSQLYQAMGNYSAAEPLFIESKKIRKEVLGEKDPDYTTSLNDLAALYKIMGNYNAAKPLFLEALNIDKETLGEKHPDYAIDLNNLASLYYDMGNYSAAEPLFIEAKNIRKEVLGEKNPSYATSLNNLALLYKVVGNYSVAEPLLIEAKNIYKEVEGEKHTLYATSLNNLAALYDDIGKYAEAETLYIKATNIYKEVLGEKHPTYATSLNNLADLYNEIGNYPAADTLFIEAKNIQKEVLGETHPLYALSLNNLAISYKSIGNYSAAEPLFLESKNIYKEVLGEKHPYYAINLINLAGLYEIMGNNEKAEFFYFENLNICQKNIKQNFSFLSEKEKENYLKTLNSNFNAFSAFSFKRYSTNPLIAQNLFDFILATKGLLLSSSSSIHNEIINSNDTNLVNQYIKWQGLKEDIGRYIQWSKAKLHKMNVSLDSLESIANTEEKDLSLKSKAFSNDRKNNEITWSQVQQKLYDKGVAIEFITYQPLNNILKKSDTAYYCALVLRKEDKYPQMIQLCSDKELSALLEKTELYQTTSQVKGIKPIINKYVDNETESQKLYKLLWKPLDSLLAGKEKIYVSLTGCLLYTSPSPRDRQKSRMPSSA